MHAYVPMQRSRDPPTTLFATAVLRNDLLELVVRDRRYEFVTQYMVAKACLSEDREASLDTRAVRVWCIQLTVEDVPGAVNVVRVVLDQEVPAQCYAASKHFQVAMNEKSRPTKEPPSARERQFRDGFLGCFRAKPKPGARRRPGERPHADNAGGDDVEPPGADNVEADIFGDEGPDNDEDPGADDEVAAFCDEDPGADDEGPTIDDIVCVALEGAATAAAAAAGVRAPMAAAGAAAAAAPAAQPAKVAEALAMRACPSRSSRSQPWGEGLGCPFTLAKVWSHTHGCFRGWGATCKLHRNDDDGPTTTCKKTLDYGAEGLSDEECELRLKRWLVAGLDVAVTSRTARSDHLSATRASLATGPALHELDALLAARWHVWSEQQGSTGSARSSHEVAAAPGKDGCVGNLREPFTCVFVEVGWGVSVSDAGHVSSVSSRHFIPTPHAS